MNQLYALVIRDCQEFWCYQSDLIGVFDSKERDKREFIKWFNNELPRTKVHGFWEQRVVFRISIVIHNVPVYSPHLTHRTHLFTRAGPQPVIYLLD